MKMKRKLALLTSVVMLLGSLNVTAFGAVSNVKGDVDGDYDVTATDAELVMQYVLNPASITDADVLAGIEANGDVATDCDDVDYTASNGTVITDHLITAKDAAFILQQSLIEAYFVQVKAGKVGGAKVFVPISYPAEDSEIVAETKEEAQAVAQEEIAATTISAYFNKYIENFNSVSETRIDQVNDFLNKVYINDWALSSDNGRAWLEAYLNVNSEIDAFFDVAYSFVGSDGKFDISTVNDAKKLFEALQKVVISEDERLEINNRINGVSSATFASAGLTAPENYSEDDTIPELWLRTTFKVGIYDIVDGVQTDADVTAMADYRDNGYSVAEWYYLNRATQPGTDEQYFRDNFLYVVNNYAVPAVNLVSSSNATMKDLVDLVGGDRLELTINQGTLPSVAKNAGDYSTLELFTAALGGFSDPTNTYYLDFSELGYDFSAE